MKVLKIFIIAFAVIMLTSEVFPQPGTSYDDEYVMVNFERVKRSELRQDIYTVTTAKNYQYGAKLEFPDGRVFRYAQYDASATTEFGICLATGILESTSYTTTTLHQARSVAGAYTVALQIASVAANDYENGFMEIGDGSNFYGARIISNTATLNSDSVVFTLDRPIIADLDNTDDIAVHKSPYSSIDIPTGNVGDVDETVVGVSLQAQSETVSSKYAWIQTWGPHPKAIVNSTHEGGADYERALYHTGNGGVQCPAASASTNPDGSQLVGYYLPYSNAGDLNVGPFWTVTISP